MERHAAERRVLEAVGVPDLVETLADLPGADLTTLLLAVMRTRSTRVAAPDVLRAYMGGRFVVPARVPLGDLRRAEDTFLGVLPDSWERIALSPLVPFATHSTTGDLSQDRVVSTIRGSEVAADATNGLCLEVAARRRTRRDHATRLATVQRIVRAQHYEGAPSHFTLFALATGDRAGGDDGFEVGALAEHISIHVAGTRAAGARSVRVLLTDLSDGRRQSTLEQAAEAVAAASGVPVEQDPDRQDGRHYYDTACFKLRADFGGGEFELSDGGFTRWTASLLQDRKERLCISGSGLDRVAAELGAR